jgi:two-component system NtrC family sensor kinase
MRSGLYPRLTVVSLVLLSVTLVVFGVLNFQQRSRYQHPDDGIAWVDSANGVAAWLVAPGGPGERAGIRKGDRLLAMDGRAIARAEDAAREVFRQGVWAQATYELQRGSENYQASVVIAPQDSTGSARHILEIVGLIYLFIGTFILVRRWSAPKSLHFYVFCLASFVVYTFAYTGKLNLFDWTVYWLNVVALIVQPALFLHFCMTFPEQPDALRRRARAIQLAYAVPAALLAVHVLLASGVLSLSLPLQATRWYLDRMEMIYWVVYFALGALFLLRSYRRAEAPLIKQQLKWVTRGAFLSIVPFAAFYAVPYFLGIIPAPWMTLSVLSLIFLPLTFGYAIVRYRLMDVDIIFQRGIAYTLATATIVGLFFGFIALFADLFRTTFPSTSRPGWILAIILTAFLFHPLVNWIQARLERFFNAERYDYRRTLLESVRELTSERRLDRLLDQVTGRLAETLGVDHVAVFMAAENGHFRLVKSRGITYPGSLDLSFLDPQRPELEKGYLFFDSVKRVYDLPASAQATIRQLDLHYYLPFKVKERTLGYLGLGKTRQGDFLSSEDVDLLQTTTSTVAIALENARLYESLEREARQVQQLRDYSENIIESVSLGLLACNLKHKVESWNSGMEKLYGLPRAAIMGKRLEEIFPAELLAELDRDGQPGRTLSLYKFPLRTADERNLIVNISSTPLFGKDNEVIGRLLIFNDITERVNLENQLMQAEKLSSIGLLAAGVAHEVNTPLAVIASQAQLLMRQEVAEESQGRIIDKIIKQSFRASEIVNHLLKFSRVSGSEYSELDLNRVIRETLSLVDPMLRASKITLNAQLSPSVPAIYGNHGRLQQVFMNLIMNARDAMPRGGELTLATECENSSVHVEVTDSGVGISPDHLTKIFDPFFTTKGTSRGTGLGLAVTYGIIREHSGKIQVQSAEGMGTTFTLEFPTARKAVNVV